MVLKLRKLAIKIYPFTSFHRRNEKYFDFVILFFYESSRGLHYKTERETIPAHSDDIFDVSKRTL